MIHGETEEDFAGVTKLTSGADYAVLVDTTGFVDSNGNLLPNNIYTVTNVKPVTDKQFYVLCATGTLIATPISADVLLANAKSAKIQEITQAYASAVNSTFTSSATGTALVYNFSNVGVEGTPSPQDTWNDLFKAIDKNLLPSTAFPMPITLANGTVVNHTQAQLQQIEADIAAWKFPLYQKYQKLVTGDIPNATTIDGVNAIKW
ncbi:DUF4376 domain-containing protein [Desulfosporosinus sp. FKA]|uniref:DUF4376 domain-containing protein n=1 Tax=Desulfosporosinus sp. FKA TaxID=1969834 RepID=UPI001124D246|nr:DUF4376 domain-containing protein [Desulfosporosinus sp. FKA]